MDSKNRLITHSFLPFARRFLWRHPTRVGELHRAWGNFINRGSRVAGLVDGTQAEAERLFEQIECSKIPFSLKNGWSMDPIHPAVYYSIVKLLRPETIVETGVCEGNSSRFLLLAMQENQHGALHSIDLPNADLSLGVGLGRQTHTHPEGKTAGWMVPDELRDRWNLHLGDARELLPKVLAKLGCIDIFIHDSLHSYDHMMFEFDTAWQHLRKGGLLISDDTDWNSAFTEFAHKVSRPTVMFNYRVGAIRKP